MSMQIFLTLLFFYNRFNKNFSKIKKEYFNEDIGSCQIENHRLKKECTITSIGEAMILSTAVEIMPFSPPSKEEEGFYHEDRETIFQPGVHLLNSSHENQFVLCNGASFRVPSMVDTKSVLWRTQKKTKKNLEAKVIAIQEKLQNYWVSDQLFVFHLRYADLYSNFTFS